MMAANEGNVFSGRVEKWLGSKIELNDRGSLLNRVMSLQCVTTTSVFEV